MKFFVTGGNGFIGSVVVRELVQKGHSVRCMMRASSKSDRIDGLAFERVTGDVRDYDSLVRGMQGCDGVLHLASLSAWSDIHSPQMKEVVLDGTDNVLRAAEASGKLKVVFVSSILAVNASDEPKVFDEAAQVDVDVSELAYSRYKLDAEKLCLDAAGRGLPVVIVNPAEVYGPHDTGMITAKNLIDFAKSWPVMVCKGGTAVVHVDDVAKGIIAAFEKGKSGERYILGGDNLTIRELAELTNDILGKKKWTVTFPNGFIKGLTKVATSVKLPLPYDHNVIPYATKYWFVDNKKA
jgi:dihydroflavonol-4-reductase